MNDRPFLYVANWKMNLSYNQALSVCSENKDKLCQLVDLKDNVTLVICPSFDVLSDVAKIFKTSQVKIGAQNCSAHLLGNYTGQVAVESLAQLGCRFCIVGHSECRQWCGETDQDVAQKIERLLKANITPLVCIGETREQYEQHETLHILEQQVRALFKGVKKVNHYQYIGIAYEPIWSIGTGVIPSCEHIDGVFRLITGLISEIAPECKATLLYGGSVDENTVSELKQIRGIGGFLIGAASLDFQKFEKIVT